MKNRNGARCHTLATIDVPHGIIRLNHSFRDRSKPVGYRGTFFATRAGMTSRKQKQSDPPAEGAVPHRRYVDNSGHIDPAHARRLRNLTAGNKRSEDEDHAFVDHPRTMVEMAENFGEQSVVNMTTGEQETIAAGPQGATTAGATSTTEGDLDSTLWERELSADEEEDVLEDMVSPDDIPASERDED